MDLFCLEFAPGIPENREFPGMDPNFRERDSREMTVGNFREKSGKDLAYFLNIFPIFAWF